MPVRYYDEDGDPHDVVAESDETWVEEDGESRTSEG